MSQPDIKPKSSKTELFFFEFTRFITLTGAVLVLIAFIVAAVLAVQTLLPEKPKPPEKTVSISYEVVAPVQQTAQINAAAQTNEKAFVSIGGKMAAKNSFPQPVVDFLLAHEGFSLKEWLDELNPEHRQAFLDNLAAILQTANTEHLTDEQLKKVVRDFAELWIAQNERASDPNAALEKQNAAMDKRIFRASCISVAFGLFITLTILCLILVLLAVERNTRLAAQKMADTADSTIES